jgi:putative hydrolase of the HAD superfamily
VIRAILFDLDDTLIVEEASAEAAFLAACERARERFGLDPQALHQSVRHHARELWRSSPHIEYCQRIGVSSWEGLWAQFLGDDPSLAALRDWAPTYRRESWAGALADHAIHDISFAETLAADFIDERRKRHVLFADTIPVLEELQLTYPMAIVTNGVPDLQWEKLNYSGLARYFKAIIISGEVGFGKPDPHIFELALGQLAVALESAVMVGNSLARDIIGAQQAGIKGIWLNRSGVNLPESAPADAQIKTLDELPLMLRAV